MKNICVWMIDYSGLSIKYEQHDSKKHEKHMRDICYKPVGVHQFKGWFFSNNNNEAEDKEVIKKLVDEYFEKEKKFCYDAILNKTRV